VILDTYYPQVFEYIYNYEPYLINFNYEEHLQGIMKWKFGTADFWSKNLNKLGCEAIDIIGNARYLQQRWLIEHNLIAKNETDCAYQQILFYNPDILICQNLSFFYIDQLEELKKKKILLVGQLSCPWPGDNRVKIFDIIFTSFPHYIERIKNLGVQAEFLPLAFDPSCLECGDDKILHDVVFIGGFGRWWPEAIEIFEKVAQALPSFKWWGYGVEVLEPNSILRERYQGYAWGKDMYKIYSQSKIALNRHSLSINQKYANNMRLFETTGMGTLLITDWKENLFNYFREDEIDTYKNVSELIEKILYYLINESERINIARRGQKRTLEEHTYLKRMEKVVKILKDRL
jgi:hypothetical protein